MADRDWADERAEEILLDQSFQGDCIDDKSAADLIADHLHQARAEGRREGLEEAAKMFDDEAARHAIGATWMGRERQRYEGPRIAGIEMAPMNGPALSHDAALSRATRIRALAQQDALAKPQGESGPDYIVRHDRSKVGGEPTIVEHKSGREK